MSKLKIRELLHPLRQAIQPDFRQTASIAAAEHLLASPVFSGAKHIACYAALPTEMDTQALIKNIWQAQKNCYLPIMRPDKTLNFALYDPDDALKINPWGILEPQNLSTMRKAADLDLIILPLLAFDLQGHRLGTGGGYYDRTLAFMHQSPKPAKPLLWGWAYELQKMEALPQEDSDVRLDGVVTELGLFEF